MTMEKLREKAHSLPYAPGVYLMQDRSGQIIYVGKAKKLRNRVSQYFQDSASHSPKTRVMVSKIDDFNVIVAASEFEALVLECSLIKRHMPRYNILLKDDKGYPYLRVDLQQAYPVMSLTNRVMEDGASYFGPYGSRSVTQHMIDTLRLTFRLPGCHKKFPRDLGKERPCLNYHMNNCEGWCQLGKSEEAYRETMNQAILVLQGQYKKVAREIRAQMEQAAEHLEFERAADLRDRLHAIESLGQKQLVTAGSPGDLDVIGYAQTPVKACFTVLHYMGGSLIDKEYEILEPVDQPNEALASLMKQYYLSRGMAPKIILIQEPVEDSPLFEQLLLERYGKKVRIRVPQRGDNVRLVELACKNALEEAERITSREERLHGTLLLLAQMLGVEQASRLESYDISNIAGTDIVASMVVFEDGKPAKKEYKRFQLENMKEQDDYGAMRQVLRRRFVHYQNGDAGFAQRPDVLLIDGGVAHALAVREELADMGLVDLPIFGMVKDGRHRTRALVTPDGREIGIAATPPVFALIGRIQEETHRFAITYHRSLRSRRLKASELDEIPGIGAKRKAMLLKAFGSIAAIRAAELPQLEAKLPRNAAQAVYRYYHGNQEETPCESSQARPKA